MFERFIVDSPDRKLRMEDFDPDDTLDFTKESVREAYKQLEDRFQELQEVLYASRQCAVLIVLQGMDCSGKDGTVKKILSGINPNGFRVEAFKQPTPVELGHDYLWRVHQKTPERGSITVFNRSYYEDVLVTRVHGTIDDETARRRFEEIRHFEKYLAANDTVILKFFLHISKDFQLKKLRERLTDRDKNWKFSLADLKERSSWDQYQECYADVLNHCSTRYAPWHVVPANHRWFRNYMILSTIVTKLESLPLQYPALHENVQSLIHEMEESD